MRLSLVFAHLAAVIALSGANPLFSRANLVVHDSVKQVPADWAKHPSAVPATKPLTLRIALASSDRAGLEKLTYSVSNPSSGSYGQHLTPAEIAEYVKPTSETLATVDAWLASNGLTSKPVTNAGDIIEITLPVSQANSLLAANFTSFTHLPSGELSVRTLKYSVPAVLSSQIKYIHPTVAFVPPMKNTPELAPVKLSPKSSKREVAEVPTKRATAPASCATAVTPACLIDFYGFPLAHANHSAVNNTLGVAGYILQYANHVDLDNFLSLLRPDQIGANFSLLTIDGGINDQDINNGGIEADLDIEMAVGMAAGVPVTFISVGNDFVDNVNGFIDIVNEILSLPAETRPTVLTTSYGFNEPDLPAELSIGMCDAYMQLGAAGISVFFASGDGGVSGIQSQSCTTFIPTAPSGCPFVTSVGGSTGLQPQVAASLSGGGFSNVFPVPDYQLSVVSSYISSIGTQYAGLYNTSGRGIPDIAAQAESVEIGWVDEFWLVSGTSCATPIFASMVSLVNDRLIAAGRPVLGFLNPFLYSPAGRAAFTDVTSGTNPGCGTSGFSASVGWDPLTGLGTPNFDLFLAAVGL